LDDKIEQQKKVLEKAKVKYEKEKETMAQLVKLRNEMRKEELMIGTLSFLSGKIGGS
jgi:hypothetical protein